MPSEQQDFFEGATKIEQGGTEVVAAEVGKETVSLLEEIRNWTRDIFFAALTAIFIVVFVVQPVKVEGTSMQPRLLDQERIFVNKFLYNFAFIERGDIVVFWYPRDPTKSFIKRVIALPGEMVEIRSGTVFINGRELIEPYVKAEFIDEGSFGPRVVPPEHYFVLGDHRNSSNDSRSWGCVPNTNIFGKAILRYWPVSRWGLIE
ncbi:MAG: signal peptidase I [Acidobacteriota bacterium]